ncbi:hypothetical protein DI09_206p20 [Mitosporidium daphniae]|uniref:Uncharacterized protein n=1 Tax=Mitosporidium daphniae TaxID=1485682 RepID=A0A098VSZ6_9MICR|nr:hypothetical protein DI09_206p20 [Mitosporidium daphniae]
MSVHSGTLTRRSVHPASPVLLTKNGPLGTHVIHVGRSLKQRPLFTHLKFENRLRSSFAPIPKFDDRFARQNRYEPPPEFPLASPYSGIVHHLSGPNTYAPAQSKTSRGLAHGASTWDRCKTTIPFAIPRIQFLYASEFDTQILA